MSTVTSNKYIAYRQTANGAYTGAQYVAAGALAHLPIAVVESLIYAAIIYGMVGLAQEASRFFFFWAVVFCACGGGGSGEGGGEAWAGPASTRHFVATRGPWG